MNIDDVIKNVETYADSTKDKGLKQIAGWLKELKSLRKEVKKLRESDAHCKTVHGAFFDELAKHGVLV